MDKPRQIPFDLAASTAYAPEDFRVSDCNHAAMGWMERWPDWPAPALILHGPPGSGKTHLGRIWQKKSKAFAPENTGQIQDLRSDPGAFLLDDIEKFIGDENGEETLFHLYNHMKEKNGHILITASKPPVEWKITLPDLKSRLLAAPVAAIQSPDDELMTVLLIKSFSDRQTIVPQEVIAFILPRIDRSFITVRDLVEKIDKKALEEKRPVTVPLVRDILVAEKSRKLL